MKPSDELFQRALRLTPWGTQTKSKRPYPFFEETMPKFIVRGKGCRIWDMEGKEYIDFRLALGPITLGYCNEEVDNAVRAQLDNGVLFSMASPLEPELAGLIARSVPNVDMCRFLKTGADANLTNVRIARATTGRDLIVTCGYHGSTDWFATSGSPDNGVPAFMQDYVRILNWGDCEAAEKVIRQLGERIACVVTVPYDMNEDTSGNFVRHLRKLTEEYGILLVLDEVLTGFRLALGGAQEYFGVKADLVSYAKAIANGYPLSVAAGGRSAMENLDRCKMTTTYAGETLSFAADRDAHHHASRARARAYPGDGATPDGRLRPVASDLGIEGHAAGLPVAPFLKFEHPDPDYHARLEFLWHRELYRNGIFVNPRWLISYAHTPADIDQAIDRAGEALRRARDAEPQERNHVQPYWW